ncbi:MAG: DUF2062 domain-containing protein [Chthoniobacteraceae bacterium]
MASRLLHSLHDGFLFHIIRLCRIRAASEKVARGFALGIVPHFFPTFGFGAIISAFFSRVCGGNGMAGFASGALFTPFWPFFFYLNLRVGSWLLRERAPVMNASEVTALESGALAATRDFSIGGIVNAAVFALAAYFVLLAIYERARPKLLAHFRRRARWRRRTRRLVPA